MKLLDTREPLPFLNEKKVSNQELTFLLGYDFDKVRSFSLAREAIYFLLVNLHPKIKNVYLPAFICPKIPHIVRAAKLIPVFLDVDIDTFLLKLPKNANDNDAILAVHTFGNPLSLDIYNGLAESDRPFLISDNARSLFSEINAKPADSDADAIILNLHKQTGLPDGALLWSKKLIFTAEFSHQKKFTIREKFTQIASLKKVQTLVNFIRRQRHLDKNTLESFEFKEHACSKYSVNRLSESLNRLKMDIEKRRLLAPFYEHNLSKNFIPQKKVGRPSYPFFSIRLKPELLKYRDELLFAMRKKGIFCDRLWHDSPHQGLKNAKLLAESVINLPLKGDYSETEICYICASLDAELKKII